MGVRVGSQDWERTLAGQLYADDLATTHMGVHVGSQDWERTLAGQLYADDLASMSGTPQGLQGLIDFVRAHSERWAWSLNLQKTVAMCFSSAAVRTQ